MKTRGFTLVEMLVVIVIVAILAAIAMPSFRTLIEGRQARAAAEQLRDVVVLAGQEALKRNAPVNVVANGNLITASIAAFGGSPAVELTRFYSRASVADGAVTLNGSGRASANTSFSVSSPNLSCKAAGGPIECYNVQVFLGGAVRLCDPTKAAGDARTCL
jgi:prepilin-type N-terminal cleavage/methylation domain-containing protein